MKKHLIPFGAALTLALFVTGCETDGGITARTQEKSAAYATLKPWDKNYIDKGIVATGFSADMVYMAVGNPTKVEPVKTSDGRSAEMWTYDHYYPSPDAAHLRYAAYNPDSPFQMSQFESQNSPNMASSYGDDTDVSYSAGGHEIPRGLTATPTSIGTTGGPQGGTIEPVALEAYTLMVLFQDGKVIRLALKP
jgi:hypothetical protein